MAEVEHPDEEARPFEAGYLYFKTPEGEMQQEAIDSEDVYKQRLAEGWKPSLADFGVETHPSTPAQTVTLAAPDPQTALMQGVLTALQETLRTVQTGMTDLVTRVSRLETAQQARTGVPPHPAAEDEGPSEAPGRGRRS